MSIEVESVLDCPIELVPQPDELIQAAMQWHFSPSTGSRFWLERAKTFDFDPRREVRTVEDLKLFPNIVNELRSVRVEDIVPAGFNPRTDLFGVFESGGTTGAPKSVACTFDWLNRWLHYDSANMDAWGCSKGLNWLVTVPSGPHMAASRPRAQVRKRGGILFTIDMDPRWVKKLIAAGKADEAREYVEHLLKQAEYVLRAQDIGIMTMSPPLLERLAQDEELAKLVNDNVQLIMWQGAHMDPDTRHLLRTEILPDVKLRGFYGSTMVLGGAFERIGLADDESCIFDPFSPYISFQVVNPETGGTVDYGDRGQVVMNHVSKGQLLPNNLERDTAIRVAGPAGGFGDSVADVRPVTSFEEEPVIEGVY